MTAKLNLTIDQDLVQKAKVYAKKNNTSVSKMVEQLLANHIKPKSKMPRFSERFAGVLDGKLSDEIVKEIQKSKSEKYGY